MSYMTDVKATGILEEKRYPYECQCDAYPVGGHLCPGVEAVTCEEEFGNLGFIVYRISWGDLIYIGQTAMPLYQRMAGHAANGAGGLGKVGGSVLFEASRPRWPHVWAMAFGLDDRDLLDDLELAYINHYRQMSGVWTLNKQNPVTGEPL